MAYCSGDDSWSGVATIKEKDSVFLDTFNNYVLFDGRRGNRVAPFSGGERYSVAPEVKPMARLWLLR